MRPCFAFSNVQGADNKPAVLSIYDEIGFWGVTAKDFNSQLASVQSKQLEVEISSPGGDVYAALAMYNALRASGKEVVTKVMGVAASAASLVFMAGDKRVMPKNTQLMIHNPWTVAMGNASELRDTADALEKIGDSIRATYASRSGLDDTKLNDMLSKDTWINADEALADGFATEVVEEVKAQAKFDMDRADLPEAVRAIYALATPAGEQTEADDSDDKPTGGNDDAPAVAFGEQVMALAKTAGFEAHAPGWALKYTKIEEVESSIATAREVKALCGVVQMADKADAFIKAGKSLDEVRNELIAARAAEDEKTHVDTTQPSSNQPTTQGASQSAVKTADIWAKRRNQK